MAREIKITPEIIKLFNVAFKKKLINKDAVVDIIDLDYGDTQAVVVVDNIRVGKVISYFANMAFPDNNYLYFFPDYSFFDFCKMEGVTQFLDYSSQVLKNTLVTLSVLKENDNAPKKVLLDYRFDLQPEDKEFYGSLCSENICFYERGNIVYQMINDDGEIKIIDDFKYSIHNHTMNLFDLKKFSNLLSIMLVKEDDNYCICDDSTFTRIYSLVFAETESLPDIQYFADILFYYAVMMDSNMECPFFEDYLNNLEQYKKLVEMTVI
jgi:hypothetical protein